MNANDLSNVIELLSKIGTHDNVTSLGLSVGDNVFIRTITMHYTGRVERVADGAVVLADAAWIADSGRWNKCLAQGTLDEVEPFPQRVSVSLSMIVDWTTWRHELPREVK